MFTRKLQGRLSALDHAGCVVALAITAALPLPAAGALNSWTKPSSGYWEEPFWSLGSLPTNHQYVAITNEGSKVVTIGPTTTQYYPSNLTVYSLAICSPGNSHNKLLMNSAGLQTPLTTALLTVASNSTMSISNSWLYLDGGIGEGLSLGGEFNQAESLVTGAQADIGYIGPGEYNLKSGTLALHQMWLGGRFDGQFNQYGGSCRLGLLHLQKGGAYNLYGGDDFPTNIYFDGGTFFLRGGVHYVPIEPGNYVQTGGTNYGAIGFNYYSRGGTYTLSNGVSFIPDLPIGALGHYAQYGGSQSVTGLVSVYYYLGGFRSPSQVGSVVINGGRFEAAGISLAGAYSQSGGTSIINGEITLNGGLASLWLNDGELMDSNVTVNPSYAYGPYEVRQTGGLHIITNQLTINGDYGPFASQFWHGVTIGAGAQLIVSNITISRHGALVAAGRVSQSGLLRCSFGPNLILIGGGTQEFGPLQLESGGAALTLPLNTNCVVRFHDSSALPWWGALVISNWSGSLYGGGAHQIIFGDALGALTPTQLSWITFQDPRGQPPGVYPAKILSNGEILPDVRPIIHLTVQPDRSMLIDVAGQSGFQYWILTSTDLISWGFWTNGSAINGTISVIDSATTNSASKFYRAVLWPWSP